MLQYLAERDFTGHIVLEVTAARASPGRSARHDLAESLAFARLHLAAPVHATYAVDGGGGGERSVIGRALLGAARSDKIRIS